MSDGDPEIDTPALRSYLSERLGGAVTGTEVLGDGLNLNLAISTDREDRAYVLRRPNRLRHTDLFNDLRGEYGVLERLAETAIPAPEPVLYCGDESIVGDPFFVTTHVEGEGIPWGSRLPERFRTPALRARAAAVLVDTLADVHALPVEPFEGVCGRHSPTEQVERATERLDRVATVTGDGFPVLRAVGDRLLANAPADSQTTLVHGDYKPDNVFFGGDDDPAITGVLDWETADLADPRTELAYFLLYWRDDGDPVPSVDDIETEYSAEESIEDLRRRNDEGFWPFTNAPGSPTRRELVDRYEERTGIEFEDDRYFRAHAAFMLGTVWADLHRHEVEAGRESTYPPHVAYVAQIARSILDGEFPL